MNRYVRLLGLCVPVYLALGCTSENPDRVTARTQYLEADDERARVLGFESLADWSTTAGSIQASGDATEGAHALEIVTGSYSELLSIPVSSSSPLKDAISFDLWSDGTPGLVQVYFLTASGNLNVAYIGQVDLSSLASGAFQTVTMPVPEYVRNALAQGYANLQVKIVVNPHSGDGPFRFDNLSLHENESGGGPGSSNHEVTQLTVSLPPGYNPADLVLGATGEIMVRDGVEIGGDVDSPLLIATEGEEGVELGADSVHEGDVLSVGDVSLRERASVAGNVVTGGELVHQNDWEILGSLSEDVAIGEFVELDLNLVFYEPTGDLEVGNGESESASPGSYGDVHVFSQGELALSSGSYFFEDLTLEPQAHLALDTTDGPVRIFVSGGITHRGVIDGAPEDFLLASVGTIPVEIDAPFKGTIWAPEAQLRLGPVDGSGHKGAFLAKSILAEARQPIQFVPFSGWDDLVAVDPPEEVAGVAAAVQARWIYPDGTPIYSFSYGPPDEPTTSLKTSSTVMGESPSAALSTSLKAKSTSAAGAPRARAAQAPAPTSTSLPPSKGRSNLGRGRAMALDTKTPFLDLSDSQPSSPRMMMMNLGPQPTDVPMTNLILEVRNAVASSSTTADATYSVKMRIWGLGNFSWTVDVKAPDASDVLSPGESRAVPINDLANLLQIKTAYTASKADFIVGLHRIVGGVPETEPFGFAGLMPFYYNFDETLTQVYTYSIEQADPLFAPPGMVARDGVAERYRNGNLGGDLFEPTGMVGSQTAAEARTALEAAFPERPAFANAIRTNTHDSVAAALAESAIPPEGTGGVTEPYDPSTGPTFPCAHWPVSFVDNGDEAFPVLIDAPEWHGLVEHIPAAFANAELFDSQGNTIVEGKMDAFGCLPAQNLGRGHYYLRIISEMETDGMRLNVRRRELGATPERFLSLTWSIYLRDPGTSFFATTGNWSHTTGVAGAFSHTLATDAQGVDLGLTRNVASPVEYRAFIDHTPGALSAFQPSTDRFEIAPSTDMWAHDGRWKFVIGHEFGHMVQAKAGASFRAQYRFTPGTNTPSGVGDLDPALSAALPACNCNAIEPENASHCLNSVEIDESAAQEGFGHFFAARLWNHRPGDADYSGCHFNYYKQVTAPLLNATDQVHPVAIDCDVTASHRNSTCGTVLLDGDIGGSEVDWLRFFWTVTGDAAEALTFTELLGMMAAAKSAGDASAEGIIIRTPKSNVTWLRNQAQAFGID
jgi:hypothetical protein